MRLFIYTVCSLAILLGSCSPQDQNTVSVKPVQETESLPVENTKLKNCRFKFTAPNYAFGSSIEPNPIQCDEGVPKKVEILTPSPLPSGIQFSTAVLSLIGTANERVIQAPYEFYLENESGYSIIKIQISIQ